MRNETTAITAKSARKSPKRLTIWAYHTRRITVMRSTSTNDSGAAAAAEVMDATEFGAIYSRGCDRYPSAGSCCLPMQKSRRRRTPLQGQDLITLAQKLARDAERHAILSASLASQADRLMVAGLRLLEPPLPSAPPKLRAQA